MEKGGKMKTFEVKGNYTRNGEHTFTTKISAESEKLAREKTYAEFGGKQGLARRHILIKEIKMAK